MAATQPLADLRTAVHRNPGARVLVDLSNVTFVDSTALHAFTIATHDAANGGGLVSFHGATDRASRLLQIWDLEPTPFLADPPSPAA